ncbi:hypothetical protein [Erythrobacter colymbi]|uniref:hypothetical protein n=1 Tax=Erythrobacter colymbi TaxID=1161202 RepID=UPI000A3AD75B|nr:hypothetical protein [Erythrobacter colymbi]
MLIPLRSALAAFALIACSTVADGCEMPAPFALEDVRRADAVFTGHLANYARIETGPPAVPVSYGLLTVNVEEVIKGQVPGRVEIAWFNSTFDIPDERPTDVPLLIAAFRVEDDMPGPVWCVLQSPCAPAFVLDDTPESRADVRNALSGKHVPPRDYFTLQRAEILRRQAAAENAPINTGTDWPTLGWLSAILAGLVLAAWLMVRRKG